MIHAAAYSGGKDSTALLLWMREQEIPHRTVFCDTGWEFAETYDYIREIDAKLGLGVEWLRSEAYPGGFEQLVIDRKLVPEVRYRFCTLELKVLPLHAWIEAQEDTVLLYQGIRAEESFARSLMSMRATVDDAGGYEVIRPLFTWTHEQVFALHRKHGIPVNPLYLMGLSRVGCAPCVLSNKRDLRQIALRFPEVQEKIQNLEDRLNEGRDDNRRSFFRSNYIPQRLQKTHSITTKDGRTMSVPSVKEVFDYVTKEDLHQLTLIDDPPAQCLSVYNLCE